MSSARVCRARARARGGCAGCWKAVDGEAWAALVWRMFWEMDTRPSGDRLGSLEVEEWDEMERCFGEKCGGCGRAVYERLQVLERFAPCVQAYCQYRFADILSLLVPGLKIIHSVSSACSRILLREIPPRLKWVSVKVLLKFQLPALRSQGVMHIPPFGFLLRY
ncbi:hypothetical protein EDD18DRAFT_1337356 [Armillaria luteobubalina]|uniref:Uncharacterized protein n=1 Tax=Armillaria luteobubalina TaxID=153913 RepID=A0AA39PA21_9AGAR|nr:hypothetical protein EDD18DRAFT_1337356 [Armillaria luteobubalina]